MALHLGDAGGEPIAADRERVAAPIADKGGRPGKARREPHVVILDDEAGRGPLGAFGGMMGMGP